MHINKKHHVIRCFSLFVGLLMLVPVRPSLAQASFADTLSISLNEALEIALVNSYVLQRSQLNIEEADQQIRQARGTIFPQIGGAATATRNLKTPNPFAGSNAEDLFRSFGAVDWLFYNEQQRLDGNPTLSFSDYFDRRSDGLRAAGIDPMGGGSNPFAVDNQFILGISATQALYNGAAFAAIRGAEQLRQVLREQLENDTQNTVNEVRTAYLRALLAQEQVHLLETSLAQLRETLIDITAMVDQGILSRFDRNSLSVEVVNLETTLIAARNGTELAKRSLNIMLGIPMEQQIRLRDTFSDYQPELPEIGRFDEALTVAMQRRPDLRLAQGAIRLRQVEKELIQATYLPIMNAFADYAYIGNVPDYRTRSVVDQNDPFLFTKQDRGPFDTSYWNASFAVGLRLQWRIFTGFQTRAQVEQVNINIRKAELDALMLREAVYLEVDMALRNVESSWLRIESQRRNIELAELNYSDAKSRLREGIGTRLEERQASSLLDQSRLNYITAVHDYLVARSQFDNALGIRTVNITIND
jgi:outer membrane protein TolC